jgi:hypothetical protein
VHRSSGPRLAALCQGERRERLAPRADRVLRVLGNVTGLLNIASFSPSGYGSWQPTSHVPSLLSLPLATVSAQIRLTSTATSGTWQVDDVFVDPFGMR